jgi:hypothetical protein
MKRTTRKPGRPATGRTAVTRSISMPPDAWVAIDHLRGTTPRGKWIAEQIFGLPSGQR